MLSRLSLFSRVASRTSFSTLSFQTGRLTSFRQFSTEDGSSGRETGTVKWFDASKGFGFITKPDGTDLFCHFSSIIGDGYRALEEGQKVEFLVSQGPKGPTAAEVVIKDASGAIPRRVARPRDDSSRPPRARRDE